MEQYSNTTIFILSCNYSGKIIPAIKNRAQELKFRDLDPESLKTIAKRICESENRDIPDDETLNKLVYNSEGSARSFTNYLFQYLIGGTIPESQFNVKSYLLAVKNWNDEKIKQLLSETTYHELLVEVMKELLKMRSAKADDILLELGKYLLLSQNPDEYLGKMIVSLFLNKQLGNPRTKQQVIEVTNIKKNVDGGLDL